MPQNTRAGFAAGFAICAGLLAFAYYLQYVELQDPCPLCMVQRVAFYVLGAIYLVAALHGPGRRGVLLYGLAAFIVAALGAAVARGVKVRLIFNDGGVENRLDATKKPGSMLLTPRTLPSRTVMIAT